MATIAYTDHARERMIEREITEGKGEDVLRSYHTQYSDRKGNPIYVGHPGGRRVKVVIAQGSNPPLVITVAD